VDKSTASYFIRNEALLLNQQSPRGSTSSP
jgi:hypothetical protein